jgi:hypothetical protein
MAHQTKLFKKSSEKRTLIMDNFYMRHVLVACQLSVLLEEDIQIIGTVHFNNVDSVNRPHLKEAMCMMSLKPQGSWLLMRSFDKPTQIGQQVHVVENAGFIVFQD